MSTFVSFLVCLSVALQSSAAPAAGALLVQRIPAPCLAYDQIGTPDTLTVAIYLPPSYTADSTRRYPTLYLLHGIEGTYKDWTEPGYQGFRIQDSMDSLSASQAVREMIVVMPTARARRFEGSFYVNSATQGDWDDCIARDLVGFVDRSYRTIPMVAARGIAGHSMGGFGALSIGMKHPDLFGAVYAMSPCCLGIAKDIAPTNTAWVRALAMRSWKDYERAVKNEDFYPPTFLSLLAAFVPDPTHPPFYAELPYRLVGGKMVSREPVYARYHSSFPLYSIDLYAENLKKLRGLVLDFGPQDQYEHIPSTVTAFSQELARRGISHVLEVYSGDHRNRIRERMNTVVLPYFSRLLASP